jgi:hypothetical protein
VSRLRFLGVDVAGVHIALVGGVLASGFLALSGMSLWIASQPGVADAATIRAVQLLAFGCGGPAHVAALGLLVAGVSVSAGLTRRLPRWMMIFGVAVAAVAELSTLVLVLPPAAYLLPAARLAAVVWMICAGALLPTTARRSPVTL